MLDMSKISYAYMPKEQDISIQRLRRSVYHPSSAHMHDHMEMLFITTPGEVQIMNSGGVINCQAPAVVIHRKNTYHATDCQSVADGGYESYCIFFVWELLAQMPPRLVQEEKLFAHDCLVVPMTGEQMGVRLPWLVQMRASRGNPNRMLLYLAPLIDEVAAACDTGGRTVLDASDHYIFRVLASLCHNPAEQITTEALARAYHVSRSKLNADFHRVTNSSIKVFQANLRIERAKALLRCTIDSITDIAYDCGFPSASYFIQAFRAHTGTTPGKYRSKR